MSRYIEFLDEANGPLLIEVDETEVAGGPGVTKAGLSLRKAGDKLDRVVAEAQTSFGDAVRRAIVQNAYALVNAVSALPATPESVEISFALKATGEVGNIATAKLGGEANYQVTLNWRLGPAS
jgi:hypothetical protein